MSVPRAAAPPRATPMQGRDTRPLLLCPREITTLELAGHGRLVTAALLAAQRRAWARAVRVMRRERKEPGR